MNMQIDWALRYFTVFFNDVFDEEHMKEGKTTLGKDLKTIHLC